MKFHYNASGSDIIPNKKFWIQLPLLVKVAECTRLTIIMLYNCVTGWLYFHICSWLFLYPGEGETFTRLSKNLTTGVHI